MIKVIKHKVRFNRKTYKPGDTIEGLPKEDEAQLVSKGYAEPMYVMASQPDADDKAPTIEDQQEETEQGNGEELPPENEEDQQIDGEDDIGETGAPEDLNIKFDPEDVIMDSAPKKDGKRK